MIIRPARPTDADAIAKVQVDSWRTTYKGILPDDFLAGLSYDKRGQGWRDIFYGSKATKFAHVAAHGEGEVVGFALGGPERNGDTKYSGELYAIYLLQGYQRRGLGRQLTAAVVRDLVDSGRSTLLVWVLEANPCRVFYEALGGQRVAEKQITVGGAQLVEIAYGWPDARILLAARTNSCNR